MKTLLRIGLCCLLSGGLMAQRGGGGHGGSGGFHGGGIRGGYGYARGYGRGFYGSYRTGFYGWGYGLGYYDPYYGYWDDPSYSSYAPTYPSYTYAPPVEYNTSPNVTIIYPSAQPVTRTYDQYGQEGPSPASSAGVSIGSPIYLIATKDQVIRAAVLYWVDGRTLHYVTLQHEEKQTPLDSVDRGLSLQLNRERRVAFQLPQ